MIVSHGWPGSVIEQLGLIAPLTDPTAHGGRAADAFDVVIPSLPGFGFLGRPAGTGWGPDRIARAWEVLMKRLGYGRYVSQGGDWGSVIAEETSRRRFTGRRKAAPGALSAISSTSTPPTAAVRLQPGGILFIPAGVIHSAKNIGSGNAIELATYIVGKGRPLVVPAR